MREIVELVECKFIVNHLLYRSGTGFAVRIRKQADTVSTRSNPTKGDLLWGTYNLSYRSSCMQHVRTDANDRTTLSRSGVIGEQCERI